MVPQSMSEWTGYKTLIKDFDKYDEFDRDLGEKFPTIKVVLESASPVIGPQKSSFLV